MEYSIHIYCTFAKIFFCVERRIYFVHLTNNEREALRHKGFVSIPFDELVAQTREPRPITSNQDLSLSFYFLD